MYLDFGIEQKIQASMIPQPLYRFYPDIQPFVLFNSKPTPDKISCIGYECYCSEVGCNCRVVYLIIQEENSGKRLTCITYGWKNFDYYVNEYFLEEEARDFTNASLMTFYEQHTKQNKAILEGFRLWLSVDRANKNTLFENHYQKFIRRLRDA